MHPTPIYLDHNATTPLDPDVLEIMRPYFLAGGNAESRHMYGRSARRAWELCRENVAQILGADTDEVVFTSGGTEANNIAIFGLADAELSPGHVVSSPIEHRSVSEPLARLEAAGFGVDRSPVSTVGVASAAMMATAFRTDTRLATLMLANNETGAIQPVRELTVLAHARGIPVHTDAVQAIGRIPVHFHELGVATLAASAHKFHGPVGVGLLLVRRGVRLRWRLFGGGQQQGRRPGTVAVPLAVGLAAALQKWHNEAQAHAIRWSALRDHLEAGLIAHLGANRVIRNGPTDDKCRLPQTVNLGFPDVNGEALLMQLDLAGVAVSLGAACASGATSLSPTLLAMSTPDNWLRSSIRFSIGVKTSKAEIDEVISRVADVIQHLNPTVASGELPVPI
jgi:cysteine desulfurase